MDKVKFVVFFLLFGLLSGAAITYFVVIPRNNVIKVVNAPAQIQTGITDIPIPTKTPEAEEVGINSYTSLQKALNDSMINPQEVTIPGTNLSVSVPSTFRQLSDEEKAKKGFTQLIPDKSFIYDNTPFEIFQRKNCYEKFEAYFDKVNFTSEIEKLNYTEGWYRKDIYDVLTSDTCDQLKNKYDYLYELPNFTINVVHGYSAPEKWMADNIRFQGQEWNESMGIGSYIDVGDKKFYSAGIGCCGTSQIIYILPSKDTSGEDVLIIFGTNSAFGQEETKLFNKRYMERNLVLDTLLKTVN